MEGFELVDHTADLRIIARGDGFEEALGWIATGMFSVIVDIEDITSLDSIEVYVESSSREALVVDWLNELLYRFEGEGFLPKSFHIRLGNNDTVLWARCEGEHVDPALCAVKTSIKAATYHASEAIYDGDWRLQVVLDI